MTDKKAGPIREQLEDVQADVKSIAGAAGTLAEAVREYDTDLSGAARLIERQARSIAGVVGGINAALVQEVEK